MRTLLLLAAGLFLLRAAALGAPSALPITLKQADDFYAQERYGDAARAYEQLLRTRAVPRSRQDETRYRRAVALGKSRQWDRALDAALEFVKSRRGTVWEARGLHWLG